MPPSQEEVRFHLGGYMILISIWGVRRDGRVRVPNGCAPDSPAVVPSQRNSSHLDVIGVSL